MSSSEDTLSQDQDKPTFNVEGRLIVVPRGMRPEFNHSKYQGINRIIPGVYLAKRGNKELREKLAEFQHIRFMRVKEIPKVDSRKANPIRERIFTIVVYTFKKATAQQKKGIQRLLVRAPSIRLRPGVLLFPYLRSKERARYYSDPEEKILDSKTFSEQVKNAGAHVIRWTRIKPVNRITVDQIDQCFLVMLEQDIAHFDQNIKTIDEKILDPSIQVITLKHKQKSLMKRYAKMKQKYGILKAIWQYDSEKEWKRVYNRILKTRRKIQDRIAKTESVKAP